MNAASDGLVPGLPLTREQALALPGMRRYRLVEFLVRWEHFGAARELLESLVTQQARPFFYQYRLAQCYLATGDVERAKQVARELYAATPTRAIGTLAIGDVFYVEGRLARAEEYYRQALEVEKTRESAQRRLAWCLLHRRNLEGAAELVEQLTAGKRPAQLGPAAVRLLAAVAAAGGRAERAAALRSELKNRWQQELDRLRTSLELAAEAAEKEPVFEEPLGLTPSAAETGDPAIRRSDVQGTETPEEPKPRAPEHREPEPSNPQPSDRPAARPPERLNASTFDGLNTRSPDRLKPPERPSSGYVYPTPRERRAAAVAAARQEARQGPATGASTAPSSAAAQKPSLVPAEEKAPVAPPGEGPPREPDVVSDSLHPPSTAAKADEPMPTAAGKEPGGDEADEHFPDSLGDLSGKFLSAVRPEEAPEGSRGPAERCPRNEVHASAPPRRGGEELRQGSSDFPAKPLGPSAIASLNTRTPEHLNTDPRADSGALRVALKELFGYDQFRSGQEEVVRHILAGRSVLATMPTGRGKSLCFQLPAMLLPRATVVISPLIALMQDQLESLPPRVRPRATLLNSSLESMEVEQRLRQLGAGGYSLIYAAPERLRQRPFLHALRRAGISLLVVDEAHCISLWGQDFRPDYLFLPKLLAQLDHPPLLAMTATATQVMQKDIREQFGVPMETVSQGVFRPNLFLAVQRCPNRQTKLKALRELCRGELGAIIVYVNARARSEHLAQALNAAGVSAGFYHAGLPAELRELTQQRFMRGELRCLVATVAFGMGVDKPDIRLIVHHDLARSVEGYYQEAGRAGRDGAPARCILFASSGDKGNLSRWAREDRIALSDVLRVHRALAGARDLTIAPDDLERETGLDETHVRVAISVLERVGALRRQYDLPRVCSLQVLHEGDAAFARFVSDARLRPRQRVTRDTSELCELTGIPPDSIEPSLLDWTEAGWLDYRGSARGLRLEPLPVPDLEARVRELLHAMEALDEARLARLDEYVRMRKCRHRFLSEYFGHPPRHPSAESFSVGQRDRCGECDNCRS